MTSTSPLIPFALPTFFRLLRKFRINLSVSVRHSSHYSVQIFLPYVLRVSRPATGFSPATRRYFAFAMQLSICGFPYKRRAKKQAVHSDSLHIIPFPLNFVKRFSKGFLTFLWNFRDFSAVGRRAGISMAPRGKRTQDMVFYFFFPRYSARTCL